jgi:uncharacterized protein (TIGR02271 family)
VKSRLQGQLHTASAALSRLVGSQKGVGVAKSEFQQVYVTDEIGQHVQVELQESADGYLMRFEGDTFLVAEELLDRASEGEYVLHGSLDQLRAEHRNTGNSVREADGPFTGLAAGVATPDLSERLTNNSDHEVITLAAEELKVSKRQITRGRVVVRKQVLSHEAVVDDPLLLERLEVNRVPINALVEAAEPPRTEGDTTIIPFYEEVLVVEKRLLLSEELHVTRHRSERRDPQRVTLRREEAVVERLDTDADPALAGEGGETM